MNNTNTTTFAILTDDNRIERVLELEDTFHPDLEREYGRRFVWMPTGGKVGQLVKVHDDGEATLVEEESKEPTIEDVIRALDLCDATVEDGVLRHYDDGTRSFWRIPVDDAIHGYVSSLAEAKAAGRPADQYSFWCSIPGAEEERGQPEIDDDAIEALRSEAGAAGDMEMVEICRRALGGQAAARARCAQAIEAARAMEDTPDA
jgi:hypothetical protein